MSIETRRKARTKWRLAHSGYAKEWRDSHKGYKAPCHTKTYESWCNMKSRCYNSNVRQYRWYGAKGIKVLYKTFKDFLDDVGERPEGKSIDRIDNKGHYQKGNYKWSTQKEQCANRGGMFESF